MLTKKTAGSGEKPYRQERQLSRSIAKRPEGKGERDLADLDPPKTAGQGEDADDWTGKLGVEKNLAEKQKKGGGKERGEKKGRLHPFSGGVPKEKKGSR